MEAMGRQLPYNDRFDAVWGYINTPGYLLVDAATVVRTEYISLEIMAFEEIKVR